MSPANGYIFSTDYESYWNDHRAGTQVVADVDSRGNRTAYQVSYYWHRQFYTGALDSCLGTTPLSLNSANNVGSNSIYPTGIKDSTDFTTDITNDTLLVRFYFRCVGDWTSTQTGIDNGAGLKFIRIYGGDGSGDDSSALLKCLNDGDDTTPMFLLFDPNSGYIYYEVGINWQDGNWIRLILW